VLVVPSAGVATVPKRMFSRAGTLIVRYDIPAGSKVRWEQTIEPGHYDLRGDKEELKRYLAPDFLAEV